MNAPNPITFWENVRQNTNWGKYVTSIEEDAFQSALQLTQEPALALEIGTEGGYWTQHLVNNGWRVICTDVDDQALAMARQRVPAATCIKVEPDATTLPCKSASISLIVCFEVFSVVHSEWFYAEAARVLRPGGVIVGVTHNKNSPRSYVNKIVRAIDPKHKKYDEDPYLYKLAYPEWKRQLGGTGFQLVHEKGLCWLPFPRKSNFFLIPQLTRLEERLGLREVPQYSPWIAFVAKKV